MFFGAATTGVMIDSDRLQLLLRFQIWSMVVIVDVITNKTKS